MLSTNSRCAMQKLIISGNFLPLTFFYLGLEKHSLPSAFKTCLENALVEDEFENLKSYRNDFDEGRNITCIYLLQMTRMVVTWI